MIKVKGFLVIESFIAIIIAIKLSITRNPLTFIIPLLSPTAFDISGFFPFRSH